MIFWWFSDDFLMIFWWFSDWMWFLDGFSDYLNDFFGWCCDDFMSCDAWWFDVILIEDFGPFKQWTLVFDDVWWFLLVTLDLRYPGKTSGLFWTSTDPDTYRIGYIYTGGSCSKHFKPIRNLTEQPKPMSDIVVLVSLPFFTIGHNYSGCRHLRLGG